MTIKEVQIYRKDRSEQNNAVEKGILKLGFEQGLEVWEVLIIMR